MKSKKIDIYIITIFIFFTLFSILISFGHIDRWILSEFVAMAENHSLHGSFYPENSQKNTLGVSVYPPGLAYLANFLLSIGINDIIFELLLTSSFLIIILFLSIQKNLFNYLFSINISRTEFMVFIILLAGILPRWFDYSLQLKPSIIAQTIGFLILYLYLAKIKNTNFFVCGVLGLLFSLPIIFKQQYISFIIGFLFFTLFNRTLKNIIFSIFSILGLTIIYFLEDFEKIIFWSSSILSDDGFTDTLIIFSEHYLVILRILFVLLFAYLSGFKMNYKKILKPKFLFKKIQSNLIFSIIFFSFFSVYLGLYKAGGNDGNIEGALIFLAPLFFYIFKSIDLRYLVLFSFIITFSLLPKVYFSIDDYRNMKELSSAVEIIDIRENIIYVTDSNTYFASRNISDLSILDNFHTHSLTLPGRGSPNLDSYYKTYLINKEFILIIENTEPNRLYVEGLGLHFSFENEAGIIAHNLKR